LEIIPQQKEVREMSKLQIITDHKWKAFKYNHEVPKKVLDDYDHLNKEVSFDGWIKYRRRWYHISDFTWIEKKHPFPKNWQGYSSDSEFSGVLIEMSNDWEMYKIGTYLS
jgi:hypothetical protein